MKKKHANASSNAKRQLAIGKTVNDILKQSVSWTAGPAPHTDARGPAARTRAGALGDTCEKRERTRWWGEFD
jgi:hypothetical protein